MTRPLSLLAVLGITAALANCGDAPTDVDEKEPAVATSITLSEAELTLDPGATDTIDASVVDQYGDALPSATLEWTSSNVEVATVADGVITAQHTGTARITATAGDIYETATVTVSPDPVEPTKVEPGDTVQGSISTEGDVDLYTFTATDNQMFNIFFQDTEDDGALSHLRVYYGEGTAGVERGGVGGEATGDLRSNGTGRIRAYWPGVYTVEITASVNQTRSGPYRFELVEIDPLPENVSGEFVYGDTIEGESIDVPGDFDRFTYYANEGDRIKISLQPLSGSGTLLPVLYYEFGTENEWGPRELNPTGVTAELGESFSLVYHPLPGMWTIAVTGLHDDFGSYRLMIERQ